LQAAAGSASSHQTLPLKMNSTAEATLEQRFAIFAQPDAVRRSIESAIVNAMIINVPVPGPMSPS